MKDEFTESGVGLASKCEASHFCHFYESESELLATVASYLKEGLDSGQFCIWVLPEPLTPSEALQAASEVIPDIQQHQAAGDIKIMSHKECYLREDRFDPDAMIYYWTSEVDQALANGYPSVRIAGDVGWLPDDLWESFVEYETSIGIALADLPLTALCTYPLGTCNGNDLVDVIATHEFALAKLKGKLEVVATTPRRKTGAEIEQQNLELERRVFERTVEFAKANEELRNEISRRADAEAALKKQSAVLQEIFEHLPVMIRLSESDGTFSLVNHAWEESYGWSTEELCNNHKEVFSQIYPDPAQFQRVQNFIKDATGQWQDFKARRKDGRGIDTSWAVVGLSDGRSIGIGQDVTERRRAEEALREAEQKYRELFENAKDAIYVHDLEGRYTSVNPAAEELTGYPRDEILSMTFLDLVAPEYRNEVRDNLDKKLQAEGETSYEIEIIGKGGQRVPIEVNSRLIRKNGVAIGVQGTARDITERRRAEEALRGYSRQLIQAQEEERQRIARELHDQIGQILTAAQFTLHSVQRLCANTEAAASADDGIRVLDEALDQVRDLSLDLRPSLLDDLGLVPALRWYADRLARRTGLRPEIHSDLPHADLRFPRDVETACFRVAQEALTNVARHAQAMHVSVHLGMDEANLCLSVKDNGVGFDPNRQRQSVRGTPTLGFQGMKERAKAVGGSLWIVAGPSLGTQVNAKFPIRG